MSQTKFLIDVWKDTQKRCSHIEIDKTTKTIKYVRMAKGVKYKTKNKKTIVDIQNKDTIVMAKDMVNENLNPLVLNMACAENPGGSFLFGATTQEEELFRRTDYHVFMNEKLYPLKDTEILYSPKVTIIKDENNKLLNNKNRFSVSMLACAAIRTPEITKNKDDPTCIYKYKDDYKLMRYKIESIFQMAYMQGHDSILLGAIGSGVYNNPPWIIATIMKDMIIKYDRCFKKISFAVLSTIDYNFQIFSKVIKI